MRNKRIPRVLARARLRSHFGLGAQRHRRRPLGRQACVKSSDAEGR